MRVLLDGDIILYRCGFAAQKGRGDEVVAEPVQNALHNVRTVVEGVTNQLRSRDLTVVLSGEGNFRYDIATERPYKGNRVGMPKPVHYDAIYEYIVRKFPTIISDGEEADDVLGITQTELAEKNGWDAVCISSIDKDLDMIPGNHHNFVTGECYFIDYADALKNFYTQLITGDSVDNVPGIPGKGIKAAQKALEGKETELELYTAVRELYIQSVGEQYADEALLEQARLLWIRRKPNEMWEAPCLT